MADWTGSCGSDRNDMPYFVNEDLPAGVRHHLPEHAQDIYREAFNHAWDEYASDPRREEIAHRVAWAAVKKVYVKAGNAWVPSQPWSGWP